jgi:hypothetical protein
MEAENSKKNEKAVKKIKAADESSKLIIIGVALVFGLATATGVFAIKQYQKRKSKLARYGSEGTGESLNRKLKKYWKLGVSTFNAVSKVVSDFFSGGAKSPMVDAAKAAVCVSSTIETDNEEAEL